MPVYNPGTEYRKSSLYGRRKHPITGVVSGHGGDDWAAPANTPIRAAYDGVVVREDYQFNRAKGTGWGNYILLEHDVGGKRVETRYAHMIGRSLLKRGSIVKKGQVVGNVGSTGGSTGNHLHFEVIVSGEYADPSSFDFIESVDKKGAGAWSYPFALINGREPSSVSPYVQAICASEDGFFPVGANSLWHGGIHFGDESGHFLAQGNRQLNERSGVRCIADGEVVAYRLDEGYSEQKLGGNNRCMYSPCFTLVRHKLFLPSSSRFRGAVDSRSERGFEADTEIAQLISALAHGVANADRALGVTNEAIVIDGESLVFFSLYMHLLDWRGYRDDPEIPRPGFWMGRRHYRIGARAATDIQVGPDCAEQNNAPDVFPVEQDPPLVGEAVVEYVNVDDGLLPSPEGRSEQISPTIVRKGINVRSEPRGLKLGILVEGACFRTDEEKIVRGHRWGKISELISGEIVSLYIEGSYDAEADLGWVFLDDVDSLFDEPDPMGKVVVLDQPFAIKAGDIVGQVGEYQPLGLARPQPTPGFRSQLHLEVFSGGDVPGFIGRCRAYADGLPDSEKPLLVLQKGVELCLPSTPDITLGADEIIILADDSPQGVWLKVVRHNVQIIDRSRLSGYSSRTRKYSNGAIFTGWYVNSEGARTRDQHQRVSYPLREVYMPDGMHVWVERTRIPQRSQIAPLDQDVPAWSEFPLQLSGAKSPPSSLPRVMARGELDSRAEGWKSVAPDGCRWWKVEAFKDAVGWVCEKNHPRTGWKSPWSWPEFEYVEERDLSPLDLFAWQLYQQGMSLAGEKAEHKMRADKVWNSSLHQKVYKLIDADRDGSLGPGELRAAQRSPILSRYLQRLIANYESEWGGSMSKWDELDPLMLAEGQLEWSAEKERIAALQWWGFLAEVEGFPKDLNVFHFHPIGIISNFIDSVPMVGTKLITLEMLQVTHFRENTAYYESVLPFLNEYAEAFEVNTPLRIVHFLSQVGHESGFIVKSESGDFSATRMREVYGCRGGQRNYDRRTNSCSVGRLRDKLWSNERDYAHNPKALFSYVYASRMGNGDEASGDGYAYRGRGIIQLTGKSNYRRYTEIHNSRVPSDPRDFVKNPDLISTVLRYGVESAFVYWDMVRANLVADRDDVRAVSRIVNGGLNGLSDRERCLSELKRLVGL